MDVDNEIIQKLLFINKNLKHSNYELNEEISCLENSFSLVNQEKEHLNQQFIKLRASFESSIVENANELNIVKCKYSEANKQLEEKLSSKEHELKQIIKESNMLKNEMCSKNNELANLKKQLIQLKKFEMVQKQWNDLIKDDSNLNQTCCDCSQQIEALKEEIEFLKQEKAVKIKKMVDQQKFFEDIKEVYRLAGMDTSQFEGESIYSIKEIDQGYCSETLPTPKKLTNFINNEVCDDFDNKDQFNYKATLQEKFIQDIKKLFKLAGMQLHQFENENIYSLKEMDKDYLLESLLSIHKKVMYLPNETCCDVNSNKKKVDDKQFNGSLKKFTSFFKLLLQIILIFLMIFYLLITATLILGRSGYLSSAYYPYLIRQKLSYCQ